MYLQIDKRTLAVGLRSPTRYIVVAHTRESPMAQSTFSFQQLPREHDAWFRAEVEQGMREADNPAVRRIPHEMVRSNWRRQRAELVKRVRGKDGREKA